MERGEVNRKQCKLHSIVVQKNQKIPNETK